MVVEDDVFYNLIRQLRSVEIDGEIFFVVEGDLLMTLEELRLVSEKQLYFFVACQKAIDESQRQEKLDIEPNSDALDNDCDDAQML